MRDPRSHSGRVTDREVYYLRHLCGAAIDPPSGDWYRLPFDYQEDNRSLADHFSTEALENVLARWSSLTPGAPA
jgi:hypothetical protein